MIDNFQNQLTNNQIYTLIEFAISEKTHLFETVGHGSNCGRRGAWHDLFAQDITGIRFTKALDLKAFGHFKYGL